MRLIAYDVIGDLVGAGRMEFAGGAGPTRVTFHWSVATTGRWLNRLAPALKPLFAWNHAWVMAQGERGLASRLRPAAVGATKR